MKSVDILVISIANPILVGIYENNHLVDTISKDGKTSDILPLIFKDILDNYKINSLLYVNGPGSFMAIKVAYIFLKTLCISYDIPLKATDGFVFNSNTPIKALGKKYFFKTKDGEIILDILGENRLQDFSLPQSLPIEQFSLESLPSYNLPAVS